jgi:hypothetical protein
VDNKYDSLRGAWCFKELAGLMVWELWECTRSGLERLSKICEV